MIDLVCKTLLDPGDVVVAEAPTYPGAVPTFCAYEADGRAGEMDHDGMRIDELTATLERLERAGRRPKFIYTVPNFHNPAGVTMSLERRRELVAIARRARAARARGQPVRPASLRGRRRCRRCARSTIEFVIYAGTFSKILSPGVRLGWTAAPAPVLEKMNIGKQASDLCSSSISQYFVAAYFESGPWEEYVRSLIEIYRRRRDVMLDALAEHLPARGALDPSAGRAVHLGHAAGLHRHDRPARSRAAGERGVRARPRRLRRRARRLGDAPELLGRRRGGDPRGGPPDRRGRRASRSRCTAR